LIVIDRLPWPLRSPTLALLTLAVILPSALLFGLCLWLGVVPFLLDLDLLIACALIVLLARRGWRTAAAWGGAVLVVLVCAVPVLRTLGLVYIADPALILGYLPFWRLWPWGAFAGVFVAVALATLTLGAGLRALPCDRARVLPVIAALLLTQTVDAALGSSRFGPGFVTTGVNISTSSAYQVYAVTRQMIQTPRFKALGPVTDSAMAHALQAPRPRMLSVAVESWGWFADPVLNERVLAAVRRSAGDQLDVAVSLHEFAGGTLSGELRELCGRYTRGVPSAEDLAALPEGCLPERLRRAGFATQASHGNQASFYDRARVYPALGFGARVFQPDFPREAAGACPWSVFAGPCDRQVLTDAITFLNAHPRAFAHVMTLDTHLPLRARTPADRACDDLPGVTEVELCVYVHRFSDLLREITELVRDGKIDRAYVYGDHAPPFADGSLRAAFLARQVPFLVLDRRGEPSVTGAPR
jgi:hypothetical protein